MIIKKHLILFFCFSLTLNLFSQEKSKNFNNFFIENKFYYGFVMPHHKSIEYSVEDHVPSYELCLTLPTFGDNLWDEFYRFPRIGIGYFFSGLSNREVYGQAHAIYPVIYVPVLKKDKFQINTRFAYGLSYLTKTYDLVENYQNIAIGSHLNIYFNLAADTRIKLSKKLELINAIGFTHFSNGRLISPNLGLNLVSYSTGLSWYIEKVEKKPTMSSNESFNKHNEFIIIYAPGTKTISHYDQQRYFTSTLSANFERNINHCEQIGLGLDVFYDASIKTELETTQESVKQSELFKVGIHGSHDLIYKNVAFVVQLGHYVYYTYEDISNFYSRVGFKYKTKKHILINLSLKSHNTRADFIEWGVGYCFR